MTEVDFGDYTCEGLNSLGYGRTHLHITGTRKKILSKMVNRIQVWDMRVIRQDVQFSEIVVL